MRIVLMWSYLLIGGGLAAAPACGKEAGYAYMAIGGSETPR